MNLLEELADVDSSTSILQSDYFEAVGLDLLGVLEGWENAVFTSVYAENEKTVQTIFLESLIYNKGELDSLQIQTLELLASDCPEDAGDAVYEARGLLPLCNWHELLDEVGNCEEEQAAE